MKGELIALDDIIQMHILKRLFVEMAQTIASHLRSPNTRPTWVAMKTGPLN